MKQSYAYKKLTYRVAARGLDLIGDRLRTPPESQILQPHKILVVRLDQLGDVVQTLPFLASLRSSFPAAAISCLMSKPGGALVRMCYPEMQVMEWECPWFDKRRHPNRSRRDILHWIREESFDAAFELRGDIRLIFLLRQAGIKNLVGYGATGGGFLLDVRPSWNPEDHAIDKNLKLLEAAGGFVSQRDPIVPASRAISPTDRLRIAVHPDAGVPAKCWPLKNFLDIAAKLEDQYRAQIIFVGTNAELGSQIENQGRPSFENKMGKTTVSDLIAVLSSCDGLLTNDSGPAHVMAALDKPVWIVWSETARSDIWAPRQEKVRIIENQGTDRPRLARLPVEQVLNIMKKDLTARV